MDNGINMNKEEQLQSITISFLRFPLIIGILFIHSQTSLSVIGGISNVGTPLFDIVRDLFSFVLSAVSVPLFFLISGYFFFYNNAFSKDIYIRKLKKRAKTLLIPYLFWNGIYLIFNSIIIYIPTLSTIFKGNPISWEFVITAFWGCTKGVEHIYPIAYHFWFIRDLMVMILLSPLFFIVIKYTKILGVICFAVLWGLNYRIPYVGMIGMSSAAIFFFMLGSWLSINRKNIITECRKYDMVSYVIYPLFIILDICTMHGTHENYNIYIHNIGILLGIIFCCNIACILIPKIHIKKIDFWSSVSFFVFAIHDPWILTQLRKITIILFHPNDNLSLLFFYFTNILLTILIAVSIYMVMKIMVPRFTNLITGGR